MAKKLYIETHGCQMNEYDSSRMVDLLGEHQALEVTARAEDADVILLNTCSIRERAQDRVYSQLGRWRELKLANPEMVIAVGGCVASQEGAAIRDRAPYVDVVFGPQTLHRLPEMIDAARITKLPQVDVSFPEIEKFDHLRALAKDEFLDFQKPPQIALVDLFGIHLEYLALVEENHFVDWSFAFGHRRQI